MKDEVTIFLNTAEEADSAGQNDDGYAVSEFQKMTNLSFPEPAIANYWRDHGDRIIWIDDEIKEDIIGLARNILRWNIEDAGVPVEKRVPIRLYINSPGGLLTPTFAVCDAIKMSATPIWAINMHEAASAAVSY